MRKIILFIATLALCTAPLALNAQKGGLVSNRVRDAVFASVGTPTIGVSLNYDTRFQPGKIGGVGGQIGVGFQVENDRAVVSIPMGINFLLGKRNHFFEMGAMLTPFVVSQDRPYTNLYWSYEAYAYKHGWGMFFSPVLGWRYQPRGGGFLVALGIAPRVSFNTALYAHHPAGWYLRLGYAF